MKRNRKPWVPAVVVTIIALGSGGWLLEQVVDAQESTVYRARLFNEVQRLVAERYVEEMDSSDLYRMAIDGMLSELGDPYSVFIGAEQADDLELSIEGDYGGLGIRIQKVGEWITVMGVIPNSPAERQGLMTGDRIVGVETESARGWDDSQAVERLRGPKGTPVSISIGRVGASEPLEFTIIRDEIHVETVRSFMVDDRIGFVGLDQFSREAQDEVSDAIRDLQGDGAEALILDLRGNPGGLLEQGVAVSDLFLPRGAVVVETRSRVEDQNFTFGAPNDEAFPGLPIVVLVNFPSASASEILAGALQDHDRALILGTPTFGKGSVQTVYSLPGGNHLKLTTAGWFTPLGRSIARNVAQSPGDDISEAVAEQMSAMRGIAADTAGKEVFRTAGGRAVYGGGGITPDVIVPDTTTLDERELERVVGRAGFSLNQLAFRFGVEWTNQHPGLDQDFVVTPEIRDAFFEMISEIDGLELERGLFDRVRPRIDRFLGAQIANSAFGDLEMFRRYQTQSPVYLEAVRLLEAVKTPQDLLSLAGTSEPDSRLEAPGVESPMTTGGT
ncbi:MAG: S41 family peptidase [Gemmatimonadetes bacterium]|nr:S41 family peptidase [Gemmatimonadota bacterium]